MPDHVIPRTYNEPTVLWRMQRQDGRQAWATLDPTNGGTAYVVWFIADSPLGSRVFDDWTQALEWCDRLRTQYWSAGWRALDEGDRSSSTRDNPPPH